MRLLQRDASGGIHLTRDFYDHEIPRYTILSHTWGAEEVLFNDLQNGTGKNKLGYDKIRFCADQAWEDGLEFFWVDTCCIDKPNSTELQEAINSMFRWYQNAAKCYVFLSDVSVPSRDAVDKPSWGSCFRKSRWFTRGWTLQELIAPVSVEFFSREGVRLGTRKSLEHDIHDITGLPLGVLGGNPLSQFTISDRLAWAEKRETTRKEDRAYSLLGLFGIHMPLIYGEGERGAFERLRKKLRHNWATEQPRVIMENDAQFTPRTHMYADHMQVDALYSSPRERVVEQDPDHLAGLQTVSPRVDKRAFEEANPGWSNDLCGTYHGDLETTRPSKRRSPATLIGEDRSATGLSGANGDSVDATTKQSLVDQLYFAKIDERLINLTTAQGKTCRWFLAKPEYKAWSEVTTQSDDGGFLWIKGNPGTGKSTLMKLLFEEAKLRTKDDPSQIMLSFFFLARGTIEEKSTIGLYRSLLHQLFTKAVDLRDSLEWMTADGARSIQRNGWFEPALQRTLTEAVSKLGKRSLTIFVDALDECDQDQAASMVCFLEELCDHAREEKVQLRICFSSRHYPTVVIQKGIEITLEDEDGHTNDIEHYIRSKLRLGKAKHAESLRSEIRDKSSGIFLWVVLVLDVLKKEYPNSIISINAIRTRLRQIPRGLDDLFEMILKRDEENLEQLHVCLKWVLFAMRPLKPQEFYFAVQLSIDKENSGYWDEEDIGLDQMGTFVRSSSKGLAEVTRNKASEVQFIHESVRDFLLGRYGRQWSRASESFNGHCHDKLKDCCLAQVKAPINQIVNISDATLRGAEATELREDLSMKFPFLKYSILNVLGHANSAQEHGVEQGSFLDAFPLLQWANLHNAFERHVIRRYTQTVKLLYILAEKNLAHLIRIHPRIESSFDVGQERYGPPIFAARATGSHEAIQIILKSLQARAKHVDPAFQDLCTLYHQTKDEGTDFGRSFTFQRQRWSTFSYLQSRGDQALFLAWVYSGVTDINAKDHHGRTPLGWAVKSKHEAIIEQLLAEGADIELTDQFGQTPLQLAIESKHEAIIQKLLAKGANFEVKDQFGSTPLQSAIERRCEAIVQQLLAKGADIEVKNRYGYGQTPLLSATKSGHEAIVQHLLAKGANTEAKDENGWTPLMLATESNHEAIVQQLLAKGANIEVMDRNSCTPLMLATLHRNEAIVRQLLKGANAEAEDKDDQRSLWCAAWSRHEAIMQQLQSCLAQPSS